MEMKAIVNVNPQSSYSKYNGLTFEVNELLPGKPGTVIVNLDIDGTKVDFTHNEVMIVDVKLELQSIQTNLKAQRQTSEVLKGHESAQRILKCWENLLGCTFTYCNVKGIQVDLPSQLSLKDIINSELSDRDIDFSSREEFSEFSVYVSEKYNFNLEEVIEVLQTIIY